MSKLEESFTDPWEEHILYVDAIKAVLAKRDQQQAGVEGLVEQANSKRTQLSNLEAEANGVKVETTMFKSFTSSFSKMIDSNPQQTRKDNIIKLQTAIGQVTLPSPPPSSLPLSSKYNDLSCCFGESVG